MVADSTEGPRASHQAPVLRPHPPAHLGHLARHPLLDFARYQPSGGTAPWGIRRHPGKLRATTVRRRPARRRFGDRAPALLSRSQREILARRVGADAEAALGP